MMMMMIITIIIIIIIIANASLVLTLLCGSQQPYKGVYYYSFCRGGKDRTLPPTLQLVNRGEATQEGIWPAFLSLT